MNILNVRTKMIVFSVLCWCAVSCRSIPVITPEWITVPPQSDAVYEYFTATGSGCGVNAADTAYRSAMESVLMQLSRYLGSSVSITTKTTGKTAADTTQLEAQTDVLEKSAVYIRHCKVIKTFTHPKDTAEHCITVSLLVQCDKVALAEEQMRLAALEQEKQAAVDLPEKEADTYAAEGQPYKALLRYIEAARSAVQSGIDNADIKYGRNLKKARDMIMCIKLSPLPSAPQYAVCNAPFPAPFTIRLYTDTAGKETALADVPLLISYTGIHPRTGRKSIPVQRAVSATDGQAVFIHPIQSLPYENGRVVFTLDTGTILSPLRNLSGRYRTPLRLLEEAADACRIQFSYKVINP